MKLTCIARYRLVTVEISIVIAWYSPVSLDGAKNLIPLGSGRSVYQFASGPVRTARTEWYGMKLKTLLLVLLLIYSR